MAGEHTEDLVALLEGFTLASAQKSIPVPYVNTIGTSVRSVPSRFEEGTEELASLLMASSTVSTQVSPRFHQHAAGYGAAKASKKVVVQSTDPAYLSEMHPTTEDLTDLLNAAAKLTTSQKTNFAEVPHSQFHANSARAAVLTDVEEAALRQTSFDQISSIVEVAEASPHTEDLAELLASVARVAAAPSGQSPPAVPATSAIPAEESTEDLADLLATAFKTAEAASHVDRCSIPSSKASKQFVHFGGVDTYQTTSKGATSNGFRYSADSASSSSSEAPDVDQRTEDLAELLMNAALAVPKPAVPRMETGRAQAREQISGQAAMWSGAPSRSAAVHVVEDKEENPLTEDLVELLAASARISSGLLPSCSSTAATPRKTAKQKRVQFAEVDYVWLANSVCQALPQKEKVMSRLFSTLEQIKRATETQYNQCLAARDRTFKHLPDLLLNPGKSCATMSKNTEQTVLGLLTAAGVLVVKAFVHRMMSVHG
mmetsp:Transcript_34371/g.60816  ORF Transcript_34371/g.60816 Transcript_34371/m.60816 type:complete len:486 (-) Transcript_34371:113-1570(-)